jgi:hypothetical protein
MAAVADLDPETQAAAVHDQEEEYCQHQGCYCPDSQELAQAPELVAVAPKDQRRRAPKQEQSARRNGG